MNTDSFKVIGSYIISKQKENVSGPKVKRLSLGMALEGIHGEKYYGI